MFLKIMSDDGMADNDYRKKYKMIEVAQFEFYKSFGDGLVESFPVVSYMDMTGRESHHVVEGNVYVMNNQGKTIESWSPST